MTVLQVCAYAAPYEGNFIASLKKLGEALERRGHKMIYAFPENAREKEWCQKLSGETKVYFLPLAKARIKPSTYRILKDIYRDNPDLEIIHCHFELYDIPVVVTAPKSIKVFWHLHDAIGAFKDMHNRTMHKIQYGFLHRRAMLLSVSENHMEYTVSLGFPEKQAFYVPNGLNTSTIKIAETNFLDRKNDFLIYGWDYVRKGVDLCINAHKLLDAKPYVSIIGKSDTEDTIKNEFGSIPSNISVDAAVTDVNELYGNTRCFLHISRNEGLSYALLEAIYAGLPIVCSDIKENKFADIFPTVYMVKSEDVQSIADGMDHVMNNGEPTREQIEESRRLIEERYSLECWTKNILEFYGV